MDRRTFLARLGATGLTGVAGAILAACGAKPVAKPAKTTTSGVSSTTALSNESDHLVTAEWLIEENAHPDATRAWIIPRRVPPTSYGPAPIEGYVNQTSFAPGDTLELRVSTAASSFQAFVYRIGFYRGFGGRPIAVSTEIPGRLQAAPSFDSDTRMIECRWDPSWVTHVTEKWPTGQYLIRLHGSGGEQQYVPFTVRDDKSRSAYVVQSSVTTWQAYNPYRGFSLYGGIPTGSESSLDARSYVVSFDRPYSHDTAALDGRGSGDFLGNEFPFIYFAERHGLDLSYTTDVDLHANPDHLLNHRALITLGHDEYWSAQMRDGAENALARGINLAFLGANACYRQIRFEKSRNGENRRVICYKDADKDPIVKSHPALATGGSWATDRPSRPESSLIGVMYQSFGGSGPLVVADESSWVFAHTGLRNGDTIPDVIGSEFDGFEPGYPHPDGVEILGHSATKSQSGQLYSDLAYYSAGEGRGSVFASGTASWVNRLWDGVGEIPARLGFAPTKKATLDPVTQVTRNVLAAFGPGPASHRHPSKENWQKFYRPDAAKITPRDVP